MSIEENRAIVRRHMDEVWSKGNLEVIEEIFATDFFSHGRQERGIEGLKQTIARQRTAFPDLQVTIEDIIAEGDKVVIRRTLRGTHKGEFQGIAPTDKLTALASIAIFRIDEGKIKEIWQVNDRLSLLQQLGAITEPAQGGS